MDMKKEEKYTIIKEIDHQKDIKNIYNQQYFLTIQ